MSTSNTTPLDQRIDPSVNAELREERKKTIQSSLARRHRKEKTFRMLGFSAVLAGLFFVVLLFGSILAKGLPAFWQSSMSLPIHFDPAIVNIGPQPNRLPESLLHSLNSVWWIGRCKLAWLTGMP